MGNRPSSHDSTQKSGKVRDYQTCQICGSTNGAEGHHICEYSLGGAPNMNNIVTLCHSCHVKLHKGEIDLEVF